MNIKRGLFRIWFVLATASLLAALIFGGKEAASQLGQIATIEKILRSEIYGVPVDCQVAKGSVGTDWVYVGNPWVGFDTGICWYKMNAFKKAYALQASKSDKEILDEAYDRTSVYLPKPQPWTAFFGIVGFSVAISLIVLVVGAAIYWALAGFAARPESKY